MILQNMCTCFLFSPSYVAKLKTYLCQKLAIQTHVIYYPAPYSGLIRN